MENDSFCKRENTVTVIHLTLNCSEGASYFSSRFYVLHFIHNTSVGINGLSCKFAVLRDKSDLKVGAQSTTTECRRRGRELYDLVQ